MQKQPSVHRKIVSVLPMLAAVITFMAYLPALRNGFVNWDDRTYVYENEMIRLIDLNFLKEVFVRPVAGNWHPLTVMSHALDYVVWGLDPFGHHLTSIVIHALNTALVFCLVIRLAGIASSSPAVSTVRPVLLAIVTALLFGLHPLHVESVAWVSERKDVLSCFFFLGSMLAYVEYSVSTGKVKVRYYSAALFLFLLALMSKPMAISLPFVLMILDYYPLGRFAFGANYLKTAGTLSLEKAPFFLLSALSGALTLWAQLWAQQAGGAVAALDLYPLSSRLAVAARAPLFYLFKMAIPMELAPLYPLPSKSDPIRPELIISLLLIAAITAFCFAVMRRHRIYFAVWSYYLITLAPVVGIVQVGIQAAADRYTYLPSLGPFIIAAVAFALLYESIAKKALRVVLCSVLMALLSVLTVKTVRQTSVWKDSITLWSCEIQLYPGKVAQAYSNRGSAYEKVNDYANAARDFDAAISVNPNRPEYYYNLGLMYMKMGVYEEAIKSYGKARGLKFEPANLYVNRGICYLLTGKKDQAVADLKKAIEIDPGNRFAHFYLALSTKSK